MSRLRITRDGERRSAAALEAHSRYQTEMRSTIVGRESNELREQAHPLVARGHMERAHVLYRQALAVFSPDDQGAAVAAAAYDLGESFGQLMGGSRIENLREAERLLRQALTSPSRQRDPIRHALTHDALGRVLRHMAPLMPDEEGEQLLEQGIHQIALACQIMDDIGPAGWAPAGEYLTNLGNALLQDGMVEEAVQAHELSLGHMKAVEANKHHWAIAPVLEVRKRSRLAVPLMNLAGSLVQRRKNGDLERAVQLCEEAARVGTPGEIAQARLNIAAAMRELGDTARAREVALRVELTPLESTAWPKLAGLLLDLGSPAEAIAVARAGRKRAVMERRNALADHLADHAAAKAQQFGVMAARGWLDQGDSITAFLEIENVSGLRYYDVVGSHARPLPADRVAREIAIELHQYGITAKDLDELASRISSLSEEDQRRFLRARQQEMEGSITSAQAEEKALRGLGAAMLMVASLARAATATSPVAALRDESRRHFRHRQELDTALRVRGTPASVRQPWDMEMTPSALRDVLAEEPGRVALRVHLAHELILSAAWVANGELVGRSARRPVAEGIGAFLLKGIPGLGAAGPDNTEMVQSVWEEVLATFDPSDILPDEVEHLIVLPSLLASLVPWAAAGKDVPLIQRVGAISLMPCLMPLWARQASAPHRTGVLSVAPGEMPGATRTHFHGAALSVPLEGEETLVGHEATSSAVGERAGDADVVVFYAHGQGGRVPDPGLLLADGIYAPDHPDPAWYGAERVELWACQSGINLPDDPLIPFVDDAFGLDIDFHAAGARSTIGTLWRVPDLVTGCLVARYRRALNGGAPAPRAMAEAQRWWLNEGVPDLLGRLREQPEEQAVRTFLETLDLHAPEGTALGGVLGQLPADGTLPARVIDEIERRLTSPEAWAGYRFVGAADRRPLEVGEIERPQLSAEEEREVQRILNAPPPVKKNVDEWLDDELDALHAAMAGRTPTPREALRAARLYADRRTSSPRHNHLRGLAWLHEAMAAPVLDSEDRATLGKEAAWMWTELARRDTPDERLLDVLPSDEVAATRAAVLVADLHEDPDIVAIRAWADILGKSRREVAETARSHWEQVRACANLVTGDAYADLRRNRAVLELALCLAEIPVEARDVALADPPADDRIEVQTALHRWDVARTAVLQRLEIPWPGSFDLDYLPQRDLPRAVELRSRGRDASHPDWDEVIDEQSKGLSLLEYYYWGTPSGDRSAFWESTGAPSRAWTYAGGAFLLGQVLHGPPAGRVPHFLACLQLGADLRVTPLNGWARIMGHTDIDTIGRFRHDAWAVDHMLAFLSDAAALQEAPGHQGTPSWEMDPFTHSASDLRAAACETPLGLPGWLVATSVEDWFDVPLEGRTAAFQVERLVSRLQGDIQGQWAAFRHSVSSVVRDSSDGEEYGLVRNQMLDAIDPDAELRILEARLRELPDGFALLGLMVAAHGQLVALSLWRDGADLHERVHVGEPGQGAELVARLAQVLNPLPQDHFPERGQAATRAGAWDQLAASLDPVLQEALGPCASTQRHLWVFAPGPLRALPALGLSIEGAPLGARFGSVSHLPSLGFERRVSIGGTKSPFTVCTLAPEREDGETRFGEAAIGTLRRWFPPEVRAEVLQPEGMDIVEVETIEAVRTHAEVVRFYAVGHPFAQNPSTVGLRLPGGRTLGLPHTRRACLPNARAVELWACGGSAAEMVAALSFTGDHLPALTRSFLMSGAHGVLDLAWPVHDLVKAMVAECFGAIRRTGSMWEPDALAQAVESTRQTLMVWRSHSHRFSTKTEALHILDLVRMKAAKEAGLDPQAVLPFSSLADAPSLGETVQDMITEACHPAHLAAFRWWGA